MSINLHRLQQKIHYAFSTEALLTQALTHRSYSKKNNERLEFLGDAILSVVISEYIYHRFSAAHEGQLSRLRASLVKGDVLAKIALELDISSAILLGTGELKSGGDQRESILADTLEAIIAAIYLDAGIEAAKETILIWYRTILDGLSLEDIQKDAKSQLQEWLQARRLPLPTYELVETRGKDHAQEFVIACQVVNLNEAVIGIDKSRRRAEQEAAKKIIEVLTR